MHTTNYTGDYANGVQQWYFPPNMSEVRPEVFMFPQSFSVPSNLDTYNLNPGVNTVHPAESLVPYGHQCDGGHIGTEGWNYPILPHQQHEYNKLNNSVSLHQGVTNFNIKSGQTSASGNQTSEAALSNNLNSVTKPTDADNKAKGQPRRGRPPKYKDPNGSMDGDQLLWVFEDAATMRRVVKCKHTSRKKNADSRISKKKGTRLVDRQGL